MKKNILIAFVVALASFAFINIKTVRAFDCSSGECYCNSSGTQCGLLRNPRGQLTVKSDKSKCGCFSADTDKITSEGVCEYAGTLKVFKILGIVLFLMKIIVPILLLIMGMVGYGKATISGDEKEIKAATSSLIKKAIAAVVVFMIPFVINGAFSLVGSFSSNKSKFKKCTECINRDASCDRNINTAVVKGND